MRHYKSFEEVSANYYFWLLKKVGITNPEKCNFDDLFRYLHTIEFIDTVPNDRNRVIDGLNLREEFLNECNISGYLEGPCSMLEMLVAFSIRIELDITGDPGSDDLGRWFWVMLENSGLKKFNNRHFDEEEIDKIVDILLNRRYKQDGEGGFFPLLHPRKDQRGVELWFQMQAYLSENL